MAYFKTLNELLALPPDGACALMASGREAMTYGDLRSLVAAFARDIGTYGLKRSSRIAMVLDNGPCAAAAFVCVAGNAVAAPLNPAYTKDEFSFYLADMKADALLVAEGAQTPGRSAADDLGLAVLEMTIHQSGPAGGFTLAGGGRPESPPGEAKGDDLALLLHTSGTTAAPKLVPLTHGNLCASAANIARSLYLTREDRCLGVMPLFHIHGIAAALLASLGAGASLYCTGGFNALTFFKDLAAARATWVSAVPTMYQAILERASGNSHIIEEAPLRFLRSSSAHLPQKVFAALEETFSCPVIESYGMTEAAHQISSNALPPGLRVGGSVGLAAGPEVAVMDGSGNLHTFAADDGGRGKVSGEVVLRGDNVTAGYLDNPQANADAFMDGWLKTGDLGTLDEDGRLNLTGRKKEIINRGGEKISPMEVEEVLLSYPGVMTAVVFALPHEKLGEEVAAAVVCAAEDGNEIGESRIREHAAARLAPFKVPRVIVFLDELPKGATGKVQRIGLAKRLGLTQGGGP